MISKLFLIRCILTTLLIIVSWFYLDYFYPYLITGEWLDLDNGFTRIIVPDTFIYERTIDKDNVLMSIIFSSVKNTIGPSLIWFFSGYNWYVVLLLNSIFVWLILLFLEKNLKFYGVNSKKIYSVVVVFSLLPSTTFYMIGSLKELPTMLFLLMILFFANTKKWILLGLAILLLILFRYQFIFVFILILFSSFFG